MGKLTHAQKMELARKMMSPAMKAAIDRLVDLEETIQERLRYAKVVSLWSKTRYARAKARQLRLAADKG
jgi:hypothetical protein